jgi:hypothetical protein
MFLRGFSPGNFTRNFPLGIYAEFFPWEILSGNFSRAIFTGNFHRELSLEIFHLELSPFAALGVASSVLGVDLGQVRQHLCFRQLTASADCIFCIPFSCDFL